MGIPQTINGRLRKVPAWPLYPLGLLPALWIGWLILSDDLGVDPVKELEHRVGIWALRLILAGLCVTPLRKWTGVSLIKYRRALGLIAFFYAVVHVAVWVLLDLQLRWGEMWSHIIKQPYITIGMAAFVMMIPLALTSNNLSVRKMGAGAWQRMHKLVYPLAFLGALHFVLVLKVWSQASFVYFAITIALLAVRLVWSQQRLRARLA